MNDWYLILAFTVIIFLGIPYLLKILSPKTGLIISTICFVGLVIVFVINLVNHFSYLNVIIFCVYLFLMISGFIRKYKSIKASEPGAPKY